MAESHTATEQWQSFELRMRQRRAQRCRLRAEAAMDVGVLDAAREALDEAQRLAPLDPELAPLIARLSAIEAAPSEIALFQSVDLPLNASTEDVSIPEPVIAARHDVPVDPPGRPWLAAAIIVLSCGIAGWAWVTWQPRDAIALLQTIARPPAEKPIVPLAEPMPSAAPMRSAEPAPTSNAQVGTVGPDAPAADVVPPPSPAAPPPVTLVASEVTLEKPAATATNGRESRVDPPPSEPAPRTESTPPAAPPAIETVAGIARPSSEPLIPIAVPVTDAPPRPGPQGPLPPVAEPPARTAASAAPATPPLVPDDRLVRNVLNRYEAAYSSLDARAAQAVWPSLDGNALARAFDGLSAQTVSLGTCNVRVTGAAALAECAGRATWTPKVGAGPQSASRRWRFELARSGDSWVIQKATMQ